MVAPTGSPRRLVLGLYLATPLFSSDPRLWQNASHQKPTQLIGNDPSAGSPTETLLRLLLPLSDPVWPSSRGALTAAPRTALPSRSLTVQKPHYIIRSVVATGGVYKGQGRNQRKLLTRAYWEFLVRGAEFQAPVPTTKGHESQRRFSGCPVLSDRERTDERACPPQRRERVASFSVARVRPRPSKGITDLLLLRLRAAS